MTLFWQLLLFPLEFVLWGLILGAAVVVVGFSNKPTRRKDGID